MIDIRNFHLNLLKIDKKPYKDIDIYYIGYITIKKIGDCENINSVNPLYLVILLHLPNLSVGDCGLLGV